MRKAVLQRALRTFVFLGAVTGAWPARGQSPITPEDLRKDLIGLADKALAHSDAKEACQLFHAAQQIRSSARLNREIAKCEDTLGHYEPAIQMAIACVEDAEKDKNDPDPSATLEECSGLVISLSRHFGTLTIEWPPNVQSSATLFIDGREIANRNEPQRLLPGAHVVRAIVPGWPPFERTIPIVAAKQDSMMVESKAGTSGPQERELKRPSQGATVLHADIWVSASGGFGFREMNGSGKISLGPLFAFSLTLPGVGFGEREQLRPYAMYRHEALARPVDSPFTARGLEIEHVGGGLVFLYTQVRDENNAPWAFRAALGASASRVRSGNFDGAYGGVFLEATQKTGLLAEGWGFSVPELTLGLSRAVPVGGGISLDLMLTLHTGLSVWASSAFRIPTQGNLCSDGMSTSICPTSQAESFFGSLSIGVGLQHNHPATH